MARRASEFFGSMKAEPLRTLYRADNPDVDEDDLNKMKAGPLRKTLVEYVDNAAIKFFVENLKLTHINDLVTKLNLDGEKAKGNNKNSKRVLQKRLTEQLTEHGVSSFLSSNADAALLEAILKSFDTEPEGSGKNALVEQLSTELEEVGLRLYLESFDPALLTDVAFELKLFSDPLKKPSKTALLEALLSGEPVVFQKKEKKAPKFSKKKQPIKEGITYEDIFQHYKVDELQEWCKENGVKSSGSKKDIIKRILAWLDGDKENTVVKPKGSGKGKEKKGGAKAATSAGKAKKGGKPKEEKKGK